VRKWAAIVGMAIAGCGQADKADFRRLGGTGNYVMVVAKGSDPASWPALAKAKCGEAQQCTVLAWDDPAKAATALPLTDPEAAAQVFNYSLNRLTGLERPLWNCRAYPRANRAECMGV
jgi:hypothetical protein